jgi:secreted trypsin-like serine protease
MTERYPAYVKGTKSMAGECGIPGSKDRIVGGNEATPHSYPWMAALFVDDAWFCGATLISDEWVLTAAHCAHDASHMRVMLGAHNVKEASEEGRIEIETRDFFTHENYSPTTIHNDIALVHLPYAVNFTDSIRPVCLPTHSEEHEKWDHEICQASGWGKPTDSATGISPVLREVTVDTITNLACAIQFPLNVNKNIICISGKDGKSTCNGDSGGPLHLVQNGIYKQIGITSFGSSVGCEIGKHAAFTRPTSYLQWIESNTGIAIDP